MNVFINTSAKVKQNKLTKQSKRYDDGFHDSDNANTPNHGHTMWRKNIHVFFTHRGNNVKKRERETDCGGQYTKKCHSTYTHRIEWPYRAETETQHRDRDRKCELKNCYFSCVAMLSVLSLYVVIYMCRLLCFSLHTRSRLQRCSRCSCCSSFECPIELNTYMWLRLAVAEYNKTLHMHTQNDRFLLRQK